MSIFWVDEQRDTQLTYDELVTRLNQREERHPVVYTDDPADVFIEILLAILGDRDLTLLDSEFSERTLTELGYPLDINTQTEAVPDIQIKNESNLKANLEAADPDWTVGLYTSGTTGTPSRVDQTFDRLTRSVRKDDRFSDHVWAFAYNPTHFAGLQVFFQAVMNGNPMIYVFEHTADEIGDRIEEYGITHISATPTFYRLRLQRLEDEFGSIQRLTSGGEKFEPSLRNALHDRFPNAEFRNVYALTEAGSLLESDGELFRIPANLQEQIKVTDENELLVHESLLGETAEKDLCDDWFHTGDIVEYDNEKSFRFVGRNSDFVNVGGYRVNPHEVEEFINDVEEVAAAIVTTRKTSVTGRILIADVQPAPTADAGAVEERVKAAVEDLEEWKQPRIIEMVNELDQSRSGKRVR